MDHKKWVEKKREELVSVAQAMIDGKINLVEGCHLLYALRNIVEASDDEIFSEIVLVESDTDHLPLLQAREHCDPDYLRRVDQEIEDYLRDTAPDIIRACRGLINVFSQRKKRGQDIINDSVRSDPIPLNWKLHIGIARQPSVHIVTDRSEVLKVIEVADKDLGFKVFRLKGSNIHSEQSLFETVAKEMQFPDYFGENWDALDECLFDLDTWLPAPGYLTVLEDAHHLFDVSPRNEYLIKQAPNILIHLIHLVINVANKWSGQSAIRYGGPRPERPIPFHFILAGNSRLLKYDYRFIKIHDSEVLRDYLCFHP